MEHGAIRSDLDDGLVDFGGAAGLLVRGVAARSAAAVALRAARRARRAAVALAVAAPLLVGAAAPLELSSLEHLRALERAAGFPTTKRALARVNDGVGHLLPAALVLRAEDLVARVALAAASEPVERDAGR